MVTLEYNNYMQGYSRKIFFHSFKLNVRLLLKHKVGE